MVQIFLENKSERLWNDESKCLNIYSYNLPQSLKFNVPILISQLCDNQADSKTCIFYQKLQTNYWWINDILTKV